MDENKEDEIDGSGLYSMHGSYEKSMSKFCCET
jgi:hypothetical protein